MTRAIILAYVYFEDGDYQKAIEMYLSAIEQNPDLFEAYLNLGICYHRQNDYAQARRYLNKVLEHGPVQSKSYRGAKPVAGPWKRQIKTAELFGPAVVT